MNRNWTLCPLCLEKVDDDGNGEPWNHTCRPPHPREEQDMTPKGNNNDC